MTILKIFISTIIAINCLSVKAMEPMEPWERVNMTEEEFILLSSITEAESNRSQTDNEGRIMIAICILNRVNDETGRFGEGITGVISQSGQFSTCLRASDGTYYSVTERTELSDQAVIEAVRRIESGEAPAVLWFNCIGYSYGTPYGNIGGNYFSCDGGIR